MALRPTCGTSRRALLLGAAAAAAVPHAARAQAAYPNRPVQLVVAAPPGGPSDALARMLAEDMGKALGQPVVIDNKPGAGGTIAAEAVARAAADGHVLMMSWLGNASAPGLIPKLGYDINRDFVHIVHLLAGSNILIAHPSTGFKSLRDMLAFAKANPDRLNYASSGNGTSGHLAMEMLRQRAGVSMTHIPYKGGAPAMNDLLAGQVQVMFINQDAVIPHLRSGRIVPLAITSAARNPVFPDLPTVAENGFPGFEATAWAGISAPRGTPPAVVEKIHAAAVKALNGPMRAKQEAIGAQILGTGSAAFTAFVKDETDKWTQVIRTGGIKAD